MKQIVKTTLIITALLLPGGRALAGEIILNDTVEARYQFVKFADIATVVGVSERELSEINDIFCGPAPQPGETRAVTVDYLKMRLRQGGFDPAAFRFTGPAAVKVKTIIVVQLPLSADFEDCSEPEQVEAKAAPAPEQASSLTEKIKAAILGYAGQKFPARAEDLDVEICSTGKALLRCDGSAELLSVKPVRETGDFGRISFSVIVRDGEREVRGTVTAKIGLYAEVAVAAEDIPADTILTGSMIAMKRVPVSSNVSDHFTCPRDLVGLRTKRNILADKPVTSAMVEQPILVKRRDIVKVTVRIPGTNNAVEANARAEENGRRGEFIRVTNVNSRETFLAEVIGPRKVQVLLGED